MKEAVFLVAALGVLVFVISNAVEKRERNERTFRVECEAVNGRVVFNNKHWECLK